MTNAGKIEKTKPAPKTGKWDHAIRYATDTTVRPMRPVSDTRKRVLATTMVSLQLRERTTSHPRPTCALGHRGPSHPTRPIPPLPEYLMTKKCDTARQAGPYITAPRVPRILHTKNLILARANAALCYESHTPGGVSLPLPLTPAWSRTHTRLSPSWSVAAPRGFRVFPDTKKHFPATNGSRRPATGCGPPAIRSQAASTPHPLVSPIPIG